MILILSWFVLVYDIIILENGWLAVARQATFYQKGREDMAGTKEYIRELREYIEERSSFQRLGEYQQPYPIGDALRAPAAPADMDDYIEEKRKKAFRKLLFDLIDRSGLTDPQIYKRAGLDRRHFSKIRSQTAYRPQKNTVIALILALKLDVDDAEELLETGGYSLSYSETFDLIIRFCLENGIYNLFQVNEFLDHYRLKPLI